MRLPQSTSLLRRMRDARLRQLRCLGPMLGGSLVRFPHHSSLYLTDKCRGKTRTLYIPLHCLQEVQQWHASFVAAKRLIAELSEIQRKLLRVEIQVSRRLRAKTNSS
jgi:hypothetical protein